MSQHTAGLRPNYTLAISRLIDSCEILLQFNSYALFALTSKSELPKTVATEQALRSLPTVLLQQPLSVGHYLTLWKQCSAALRQPHVKYSPVFRALVDLLPDIESDSTLSAILNGIPEFRNRKKGHSFTLPPKDAETLWNEWNPRLIALLNAIRPPLSLFRLVAVNDTADDDLVELRICSGNQTLSSSPLTIAACRDLTKGDLAFVSTNAILQGAISSNDLVALSPLLRINDDRISLFQGKRGKLLYISSDATEHPSPPSGETDFRRRFAQAFSFDVTAKSKPPKWTESLTTVEFLCDGAVQSRRANPLGFYQGSPCNWADIEAGLDANRRMLINGKEVSNKEFVATIVPILAQSARTFQSPLFVLQGPGGSGKTTALTRLSFDIWRSDPSGMNIIRCIPGEIPSIQDIRKTYQECNGAVVCLMCDEYTRIASEITDIRHRSASEQLPLFILAADRSYLVGLSQSMVADLLPLSDDEILHIVTRLEEYGQLGILASMSLEQRLSLIRDKLDRQVLVALREATSGRRFDEILRDEYEKIPSEMARRLYTAICIAHSCGANLPEIVAMSFVEETSRAGFGKILQGLKDLVVRAKGISDRSLVARHRIIAEFVVAEILQDIDECYRYVYDVVSAFQGARINTLGSDAMVNNCATIIGSSRVGWLLSDEANRKELLVLVCGFKARARVFVEAIARDSAASSIASTEFACEIIQHMENTYYPIHADSVTRLLPYIKLHISLQKGIDIAAMVFDRKNISFASRVPLMRWLVHAYIEKGDRQAALDAVDITIKEIGSTENKTVLFTVLLNIFEPLAALGAESQACTVCMAAIESKGNRIPAGATTLAVKVAKTLRAINDNARAIAFGETLLRRWNYPTHSEFHQLVNQMCRAAAGIDTHCLLKTVRELQPHYPGCGVMQLAEFVRLDEQGNYTGDNEIVEILQQIDEPDTIAQIIGCCLAAHNKQETIGKVVRSAALVQRLSGVVRHQTLEWIGRSWIDLAKRSDNILMNADDGANLLELVPEVDWKELM